MDNKIYYRSKCSKPLPLPPKPHKSPSNKNKKKIKFDFKKFKKNTVHSLFEVELFLNDFHKFLNYVKLYKILK